MGDGWEGWYIGGHSGVCGRRGRNYLGERETVVLKWRGGLGGRFGGGQGGCGCGCGGEREVDAAVEVGWVIVTGRDGVKGGGGGKMGGELEVRWTGRSTAVGSWSVYYVQGGMGM